MAQPVLRAARDRAGRPRAQATSNDFGSTLLLRGWQYIMLTDHYVCCSRRACTSTSTSRWRRRPSRRVIVPQSRHDCHRRITSLAHWGAIFRNTYSVLNVSHGYVYDRATPLDTDGIYDGVPVPLRTSEGKMKSDERWYPTQQQWGAYRSVMRYGQRNNPNYKKYSPQANEEGECTTRFGDASIANAVAVPTTPRYLWMMSSCRTMAEPSLADALHARGTWFVIGWIYAAAAHECRLAITGFYAAWRDLDYDPDAVPQLFRTHFLQPFARRGPTLSIAPAVAQALGEQARITASLEQLS
ncbi:MAG: hypothetical protein U0168_24635 [Nannocystaceae bacterium]